MGPCLSSVLRSCFRGHLTRFLALCDFTLGNGSCIQCVLKHLRILPFVFSSWQKFWSTLTCKNCEVCRTFKSPAVHCGMCYINFRSLQKKLIFGHYRIKLLIFGHYRKAPKVYHLIYSKKLDSTFEMNESCLLIEYFCVDIRRTCAVF